MEQIQNINNIDLITAKELISIPPDDTTRQFVKITSGVSVPGDGYVGSGTYFRKPDGSFEPVVGGGMSEFAVESGIVTRVAGAGNGSQVVPTTKRPKIIFFNSKFVGLGQDSQGQSDGINESSISNGNTDQTFSVGSKQNVNNFSGEVNAANFTDTSFQIDWTQGGAGDDVLVMWFSLG